MRTPVTARLIDELTALEERLDALKQMAHSAHHQHLAQLEDNLRCRMTADPWNDGRSIEDRPDSATEDHADAL